MQKAKRYKYTDFIKDGNNDDALLNYLWNVKYGNMKVCPKCGRCSKYTRVSRRSQWQCSSCRNCITPLKGTLFYRSHISLSMWFYAICIFIISKNGLSAKELERVLGVTYETAYNMLHKIKALVVQENHDTYFQACTTEADDSYFDRIDKTANELNNRGVSYNIVAHGHGEYIQEGHSH